MYEFKVGDKVRLDPKKVGAMRLTDCGSHGTFGNTYIIATVHGQGHLDILLKDSNWHSPSWLTLVPPKNIMGGKLLE